MKKSLIALAVAGAVAAPSAIADVTLYGTVAIDYVKQDIGTTTTGGIQRDDNIIGVKASSQLDNGMTVSGEIRLDNGQGFDTTDQAYVAVEGGFGKVWAGRFSSPLNALDTVDYSDTLNLAAIPDEVINGLAYTSPDFGGFDFYLGGAANRGTSTTTVTTTSSVSSTTVFAEDVDGSDSGFDTVIYGVNFSAGGFKGGIGGSNTGDVSGSDDTELLAVMLGYSMDALSVQVNYLNWEDDDGVVGNTVSGVNDEVTQLQLSGSYKINNTTISAFIAEDEYDSTVAGGENEEDIWGIKVNQSLGGGANLYAEWSDRDSELNTRDGDSMTIGMSYSF